MSGERSGERAVVHALSRARELVASSRLARDETSLDAQLTRYVEAQHFGDLSILVFLVSGRPGGA